MAVPGVIVGLFAMAMAFNASGLGYPDDQVAWHTGYDAAMTQAAKSNKPAFVVFTSQWCPPCRDMKRDVYSRPEVADVINSRFVPIKIDLTNPDQETQWAAQQHQVQYLPTLLLLSPDGREISRVVGFHDHEQLLAWLGRSEHTMASR